MKASKRDLLVLLKTEVLGPARFQSEVSFLEGLLKEVEGLQNVALAYELVDVHRRRLEKRSHIVKEALKGRLSKPFLFLNNRN
jgi:hypothetical protein